MKTHTVTRKPVIVFRLLSNHTETSPGNVANNCYSDYLTCFVSTTVKVLRWDRRFEVKQDSRHLESAQTFLVWRSKEAWLRSEATKCHGIALKKTPQGAKKYSSSRSRYAFFDTTYSLSNSLSITSPAPNPSGL